MREFFPFRFRQIRQKADFCDADFSSQLEKFIAERIQRLYVRVRLALFDAERGFRVLFERRITARFEQFLIVHAF